MVFMLHDAILFPNAARIARRISEQIYTHSSGEAEVKPSAAGSERLWIDSRARLISRLRQGANVAADASLPQLRHVVLDLTRVTHIDTTGMQALADIRSALIDWSGDDAELRFVGMNEELQARFTRAAEAYELDKRSKRARYGGGVVFDVLQTALTPEHGQGKENLDVTAEGVYA